MKFQSKFNRFAKVFSKAGEPTVTVNILNIDGSLAESYIDDLDALIQSNADSGDVSKLIERFTLTGDDSVFNVSNGFYGDVSGLENLTIHDYSQRTSAAIDFYDSLPKNIKEMYPSPEEFFKSIDDPKLSEAFDNFLSISNTKTSDSDDEGGDNNAS
ncbi:minor capsid protein [Capybara microvirus Cap3_SP_632]|nr:minor capsid protein [Capybara microvirus Cap3_SP_632]